MNNNNKFTSSNSSPNLLDIEKFLNNNNVTNKNFNNFIRVKTSLNENKFEDKKEDKIEDKIENLEKPEKSFNKTKKKLNNYSNDSPKIDEICSSNENSVSNVSIVSIVSNENSINNQITEDIKDIKDIKTDLVKTDLVKTESTNYENIYNLMDTLTNLKLLSHVKQSDKLACNGIEDIVHIDTRYYLQGIRRWYYGDNRDETIKFIERLIISSENLSESLILGLNQDDKHNLKLLTEDLISCKTGLNNLKSTYFEDKLFISRIENYIEKVNMRINKNNKYIA